MSVNEQNNEQQQNQGFNAQNIINSADETGSFSAEDIEKNKVISALAYLGFLFFLPLVACPESKFGRFHANQGLVLLFFGIALNIVVAIFAAIVSAIFASNWQTVGIALAINGLLGAITWLITLGLLLYGAINTFQGKAKELPVIGKLRIIK